MGSLVEVAESLSEGSASGVFCVVIWKGLGQKFVYILQAFSVFGSPSI